MEINSAFSSGVNGLNNASQQMTESSQRIANPISQNTEQNVTPEAPTATQLCFWACHSGSH